MSARDVFFGQSPHTEEFGVVRQTALLLVTLPAR